MNLLDSIALVQFDHLETFLELARNRSFSRTAERMHVTQSTVSMRIKVLETTLDRTLFHRGRGDVSLSRAGERFHRYAVGMRRMWQQAVQEVRLPEGYTRVISVSSQVSLWERLMLRWLPWMRQHAPHVAINVSTERSSTIAAQLGDGTLDLALMYEPQTLGGITVERLLDEKLVLVSNVRRERKDAWVEDYVYVDWGEEFRRQHAEAFTSLEMPSITVDLGELGLRHVLLSGGSGYFPLRMVASHLREKRLYRVEGAPQFRRPVFYAYASEREEDEVIETAVRGLRHIAGERVLNTTTNSPSPS